MWKYFFLKENVKIRWWFSVLCSDYVVPSKNESIERLYIRSNFTGRYGTLHCFKSIFYKKLISILCGNHFF